MPSGGKRKGAGKPKLPESQKRITRSFRIAPETAFLCRELQAAGYQTGRLIDDLFAGFARHVGILEPLNDEESL